VKIVRINPILNNMPVIEPEKSNIANLDNRMEFNPIKKVFHQVNDSQLQAHRSQEQFALGEVDSIHRVMIDMEDALMAMKFATQLRNKAVEAYQEVMRMQV
jgi:flagellar hook-basal body complex protein FliE